MLNFNEVAMQCASGTSPAVMSAVIQVESGGNPYAIGVVGGRLERQPKTLDEAVETAESLAAAGWNFSVGLAQVNIANLKKFHMTFNEAFQPCANLHAGARILTDCYRNAVAHTENPRVAMREAFSCYYSGNFNRGFMSDRPGEIDYVHHVLRGMTVNVKPVVQNTDTYVVDSYYPTNSTSVF